MELSRDIEQASFQTIGKNVSAWLVVMLSVSVLLGWQFDVEWLKRPLPNSVAMNPLTAICFLLASLALLTESRSNTHRFLFGSVILFSVLKCISLLFGYHIPIDTFFFSEKLKLDVVNGISNRMASNTAIGFFLVSSALLLKALRRPTWISELIILLALSQGMLSLIGYGFQVPEFYGALSKFPMAVHTAAGFVVLSIGMLFLRPHGPFVSTFSGKHSGTLVARLLLPLAICLPIFLGALRLYGERQGLFSSTFGLMLIVSIIIFIFCFVIWYVAVLINEKDVQQKHTEFALEQLNEELEQRVAERTAEALRQRQKAEAVAEELRASEQRFRALVENAGDAVIVVNEQLRPTYVSGSIEKMLGYTVEEAMEIDMISILHPDDGEGVQKAVMHSFANPGVPVSGHTARTKHKDGSWRWLEATITNLLHDPAVNGIVDNFRDVTERVEAEKQLTQSELHFRQTLDNMLEGVQIIGHDWQYLYINKTLETQGGFTWEQLKGHTMQEMYPGLEQADVYREIEQCLIQRTSKHFETIFQFPDGRLVWFELSIQPVPEGVFILSIDVTDRKRAQEAIVELNTSLERKVEERTAQLQASNKELESFSYSVSHDLRAPLRAINGFTKILEQQNEPQLDEDGKRLLSIIKTNAQTMGNLIDDLLEFSRTGRADMRSSEVDMAELVNSVMANIDIKRAHFEIENLPRTHCDPTMMAQVWSNLISNALKYSAPKEQPQIRIWSTKEASGTQFHIQDNGVGFDMQYAGKLFGVFQRLHSPRDFEGTGVGLAIVYRIIGKHGGSTWAEAELDQGATFHFSLPD